MTIQIPLRGRRAIIGRRRRKRRRRKKTGGKADERDENFYRKRASLAVMVDFMVFNVFSTRPRQQLFRSSSSTSVNGSEATGASDNDIGRLML